MRAAMAACSVAGTVTSAMFARQTYPPRPLRESGVRRGSPSTVVSTAAGLTLPTRCTTGQSITKLVSLGGTPPAPGPTSHWQRLWQRRYSSRPNPRSTDGWVVTVRGLRLILISGVGRTRLLVCPAFPVFSGWAVCGGVDGLGDDRWAVSDRVVPQPEPGLDQGQWVGRCSIGRRCGRASRAATLMIRRRRVDPRARACWCPASTPAARSRLCAIAAHKIQAELAPKRPEVIWS